MDDKGGLVSQELKIKCEYTELVEIHKLVENPKNANKHTKEQIDRLAKILQFQGWRHPVIVSKRSGFICAGHGRLLASKLLKQESVPVDYQDFLTEAEEYAFVIADNEIARWAEFDEQKFIEDVANIDIGDIDLFGLKEVPDLLQDEKQELTDPDDIPEVEQNIHNVQLGQIYKLGEHRLMCGDSTKIEDVERLMDGQKADMVFTDPPYNLQEHGQTKRTNKTDSKTEKFGDWDVGFNPLKILPLITSFTKDDAHQFVCTSNWLFGPIHKYFEDLKEKPNYLVWLKNNPMPSLSKSTFVQSTELIIHSRKGSPKFNYPSGQNLRNIIEGNVEPHTSGHPSQKPIYVVEYCLKHTDGTVLDLFLGSGSTLIACEKTNRKCYGMELDPHYCSVIIERWQQFTGKKAELLNG